MMTARRSKVVDLPEAAALVRDGSRLAIGGFSVYQHPMAFLYELIRQGRRDLTIVGMSNGNDIDLLCGAGCVSRVETSYVGLERNGLAPNYRRAVENGTVKVVEYSEVLSQERFRASQENFGFWPVYYLGGNGILDNNPDIKAMACPLTGRPMHAVPPAAPDVAVIHALMADEFGNVLVPMRGRLTPQSLDIAIARSCSTVVVTVEKIVDNATLRRHPHLVELPSYKTTAIVEAPYGAHPTAMAGAYAEDEGHMDAYALAGKDPASFDASLQKYVHGLPDHLDYLDTIGVRTLMKIRHLEVPQ